jgi:hypothetical protein
MLEWRLGVRWPLVCSKNMKYAFSTSSAAKGAAVTSFESEDSKFSFGARRFNKIRKHTGLNL